MMGCGLSSSRLNALCFGSKSMPGTVARARSSGAKSISTSNFRRLSSFSLSILALFDSAYRNVFSPFGKLAGAVSAFLFGATIMDGLDIKKQEERRGPPPTLGTLSVAAGAQYQR